MIIEKDITAVGKFQRTHALKGELNMILDIDPEFFEDGDNPMIVEMEGCYVPFYAESIRTKGQTSFLVKIDRVDSEEQARRFVNKTVYAIRDALKEFMAEVGEELITDNDWEGFDVSDVDFGRLGVLESINDSTVNILLVIRTDGDEELFVPLTEEFIVDVNPEERKIVLNLPEGLIDLNKKKDD